MALPDFWLPREIQDRRVAPDAQIMEVLSRSFPQLHMWVVTNAVWLLLLYFLGLFSKPTKIHLLLRAFIFE